MAILAGTLRIIKETFIYRPIFLQVQLAEIAAQTCFDTDHLVLWGQLRLGSLATEAEAAQLPHLWGHLEAFLVLSD